MTLIVIWGPAYIKPRACAWETLYCKIRQKSKQN